MSDASPQAESCHGRLEGAREGEVLFYKGIPFAAPPVGAFRWRPPQPVQAWAGVQQAKSFGDDCMQVPLPRLRGPGRSEDCLYLNVWAPAARSGGKLPVLVWIPGGGFVGGSGSDRRADGARFAAMGVVVVTVNYRVGMFGYLAHPALTAESEHGASGNYGLMDQIAALEWVRDNITAFGGDPDRVTVAGVSAGSASIGLLMASSRVRGLYHRAVLQSPGVWRPLTPLDEAEAAGLSLGGDVAALRAMSAEALFSHTARLNPAERALTGPRTLRPINDGWLLSEDDRNIWKRGDFESMPLIVGTMEDEGSLFTRTWPVTTTADFRTLLQASFGDMAGEAARLYPASSEKEVAEQLAFVFGDTQFTYGAWGMAEEAARVGQPVWRYLITRNPGGRTARVRHGEDVVSTFGNLQHADAEDGAIGKHDEVVSDTIMRAWLRFIHGEEPDSGLGWAPHKVGGSSRLEFGDEIRPGDGWRSEQIAFLDRYFNARAA
jgi:para-nitrobenzyl esterase